MPATAADLQIVQIPIDDLRPDPANPRRISPAELDSLTRSLHEFGFIQPVIAGPDGRGDRQPSAPHRSHTRWTPVALREALGRTAEQLWRRQATPSTSGPPTARQHRHRVC
jgi:ParB/Sulfiredoxin domain